MDNRYGIAVDRCPPSFSSTLLDSICRSFDESGHVRSLQSGEGCFNGGSGLSDRSVRRNRGVGEADGGRSRDRTVDRWMEKSTTRHDEFVIRRRSVPPLKMKSSSTSSSDSSSGFGFSSSDFDSISGNKKKKLLKPIKTSVSDSETLRPLKTHCDGRKTAKSRAMKIYGEIKRIKQPISPGGKVASFLNSLFSAGGNGKKQRISKSMPATFTIGNYDRETSDRSKSKSNSTTPSCSTASSYTRSCLSKSPTSSGEKRSVRFRPLNVGVDGDLISGATSRRNSKSETELALRAVDNNRKSVEEVAMDLMRNYYKKWGVHGQNKMIEDQEAEDVESCCSSDLFELENLMEISAELPVYETTHLDTNRAIASGLIK